jgi:excinuclease UvrABC ATPase subunit
MGWWIKETPLPLSNITRCYPAADYIIDLGPEGGDQGGYVVASVIRNIFSNRMINPTPHGFSKKYLSGK